MPSAIVWAILAGSAPPRARSAADLTNPFLGPEHSSWLVGPIARIASPDEIAAYLALTDDGQAGQLIDQFWARRDQNPDKPGNPLREAFDERSTEADRRFTEAGYRGLMAGRLVVLQRQPASRYLDMAEDLDDTQTGLAPFGTDPTRGQLLGLLVQTPDLTERIAQGGPVGYVIIALGVFGLIIALWRLLALAASFVFAMKMRAPAVAVATEHP